MTEIVFGAVAGVLREIIEGGDALHLRTAQMHRVRVEPQLHQEGHASEHDDRGDDEDEHAMVLDPVIDGRERSGLDRTLSPAPA